MGPTAPPVRHDPIRLAVLLSGEGTTLQHLAEAIEAGTLRADIRVVISSNERAHGLKRAEHWNIPAFVVPRRAYESPKAFSDHVFGLIRDAEVDLVCLAGFLSLLAIPPDFEHRVLNVHPALLPSFGGAGMYGKHVHQAVLEAGCKVSGCTVHFADQEYDRGPILLQRCCSVFDDDTSATLAERVAEEERLAYPQAVRLIAEQRVVIAAGRRTRVMTGEPRERK